MVNFVLGSVFATVFITIGNILCSMRYKRNMKNIEPEKDETQERLDRQWEALYKYDGRES